MQRGDTTFSGDKGWRLDRYKFLPMVEQAKAANPTAEWFVFLETDTYFFWDNLFRLLDQFDPSSPLYFGLPSPGFWLEGERRVWFGYGGSGFVLSRAAVEKLTARNIGLYGEYLEPSLSERYMEVVDRDCCGDWSLGLRFTRAACPCQDCGLCSMRIPCMAFRLMKSIGVSLLSVCTNLCSLIWWDWRNGRVNEITRYVLFYLPSLMALIFVDEC